MAYLIGTGTQGAAAQQELKLKDVDFPVGYQAERVRMKLGIPFKNTSGGPATIFGDDIIDALAIILGTNDIKFGKGEKKLAWKTGEDFDLGFRKYALAMEEDDIQAVKSTGAVVELTDAVDLTALTIYAAVANNATQTVVVEVSIPFVYTRAGADRHEWCPGTTQMRQMAGTFKRATGFSSASKIGAGFEQDGEVSCLFLADIVPGDDEFHMPPTWFRKDEKARDIYGPGGRLLCALELTAAGAASSVPQFDLFGELDDSTTHIIHKDATAADLVRNRDRELDEGAADLMLSALVLHEMRLGTHIDAIPVARRWVVHQVPQSPIELDVAFLVAPIHDDAFVDIVTDAVTSTKGANETTAKLTSAVIARRPDAPAHSAETAGVKIARPGGTDYAGSAGVVVRQLAAGGAAKVVDIPGHQSTVAQSVVKAAAESDEKRALASKLVAKMAASIPGSGAIARSTTQQAQRSPKADKVKALLGGDIASILR